VNSPQLSYRRLFHKSVIVAFGLAASLCAQTYTATPIASGNYTAYPYNLTGMLRAPMGSNFVASGSGAVVRHPRLVYSCAHVVFDEDAVNPWLTGVRWHRVYSSSSAPSSTGGQLLRGYHYLAGYAAAARAQINSFQTFSMDFVVHYAYEDTANGSYANYHEDGVAQLLSTKTKLITGYPTGNYASGHSQRYLMHNTGPFTRAFTTRSGDYVGITEASTGPGNSGGPVWVNDGGQYAFAGVLVSGLERSLGDSTDSAGVYGVDSSSASVVNAAISDGGGTILLPAISGQPTSRRVGLGQSASFTVTATGAGLAYSWFLNDVAISGATSATLTLGSVTLAHAGTYHALVSNSAGEVRSTAAILSVDPAGTNVVSLYASESTAPARLFNVSVSNGAGNSIGSLGFFPGIEFRNNGVLYGAGSTLSTLSKTSGSATTIGALPESRYALDSPKGRRQRAVAWPTTRRR